MNDWECHAGGTRQRCTHPQCKPRPDEWGESIRGMRPKDESAAVLERVKSAAEFLVSACDGIQVAEAEIESLDKEMKALAVRQQELRENVRALHEKSGSAINTFAAAFGHARIVANEPEENHA